MQQTEVPASNFFLFSEWNYTKSSFNDSISNNHTHFFSPNHDISILQLIKKTFPAKRFQMLYEKAIETHEKWNWNFFLLKSQPGLFMMQKWLYQNKRIEKRFQMNKFSPRNSISSPFFTHSLAVKMWRVMCWRYKCNPSSLVGSRLI